MRPYRILGASLGWFAILSQYWLSTTESGLLTGTITYFGFFTILGNILVALAFTMPLLPNIPRGTFFSRPGVRTAIGVYILVVGVIFYLLLRKLFHPVGLGYYVNILLHYVMPPLYLLDWIMFVPKRGLTYRQVPYWLIFPLAYAAFVLLHGAVSGYYPYPFLDVATYGYRTVFINIGALTLVFILLSAAFVTAGRYTPGIPKRGPALSHRS